VQGPSFRPSLHSRCCAKWRGALCPGIEARSVYDVPKDPSTAPRKLRVLRELGMTNSACLATLRQPCRTNWCAGTTHTPLVLRGNDLTHLRQPTPDRHDVPSASLGSAEKDTKVHAARIAHSEQDVKADRRYLMLCPRVVCGRMTANRWLTGSAVWRDGETRSRPEDLLDGEQRDIAIAAMVVRHRNRDPWCETGARAGTAYDLRVRSEQELGIAMMH